MAALAPIAAIAGLVGAGVSAVGTIEGGEATQNMAAYQAQVAKNNQIIADQNAQYAIEAGEASAAATSLKGAAVGGKIKAGQAANNIDVNSGSAVAVQQSQREQSQLDTETVVNNAELQYFGYRAAATGYGAQAGLETMEEEEAVPAALTGAAGNLLSNASAVGFNFTRGNSGSGNAFTPGGATNLNPGQPLNILPS
jgi:hypothetical protein